MNFKQIIKKRWVKILLEILFFVLLYLSLRAYQQWDMISGSAPQFEAITLQQRAIDLYSNPKPTLVHFWATWCAVCKLEQDSIVDLSKDYNVITIAMQSGSDQEIKDFMAEHKLDFQVINDKSGELVNRYGVVAVPASFVVDSNNQITSKEVGYTTEWGLRLRLWLAD